MEDDQIQNEQDEKGGQDSRDYAKDRGNLLPNQADGKEQHDTEEKELQPHVDIEVLLVALTHTISDPRTMMVKC